MGTIALAEEIKLYEIEVPVDSRTISFENPTGEKGKAGMASSKIGVGRKGLPAKEFRPGQTYTLCDIQRTRGNPAYLGNSSQRCRNASGNRRSGLLGRTGKSEYRGAAWSIFRDYARQNRGISKRSAFGKSGSGYEYLAGNAFCQTGKDYPDQRINKTSRRCFITSTTPRRQAPSKFGRLHAIYRRENPTTLKQDFEILPKRTGSGWFVGCVLGIRALEENWWGEGEVKVYPRR